MKKILLGFFLLPFFCKAQTVLDKENGVTVNASIGAGYLDHNVKPMGKFSLGGQYEGNHLSANIEAFATNLKSYPAIMSINYGVVSRSWEVFGGAAYHLYSLDYGFHKKNDWYPLIGILHKFNNSPVTIEAEITNNIFSLKMGLGCVR